MLDGEPYGVPWYVDTRVLFYRKDLLARAGYSSLPQSWDFSNYASVFRQGAVASALTNSIVLGLGVATVGSLLVGVLTWVIFRARVPGRSLVEYVVMFPQAVPRLVFGLGLLWAWLWVGQVLPFTLYAHSSAC